MASIARGTDSVRKRCQDSFSLVFGLIMVRRWGWWWIFLNYHLCLHWNSLKSEERQQNRQWAAVTLFIVPSKMNVVFKVAQQLEITLINEVETSDFPGKQIGVA